MVAWSRGTTEPLWGDRETSPVWLANLPRVFNWQRTATKGQDCRMTTDPARYFGKQVRKARLAAGWTLKEFGDRIAYSPGQISRIESGSRPPNKMFAKACDGAFPGMGGWFSDFFQESREWLATPPWFRPWIEHEQSAQVLKIWTCGLFPGLAQAEDYTRAVLACEPGV